jgi:SagB-type dehydrogenase family enzyme
MSTTTARSPSLPEGAPTGVAGAHLRAAEPALDAARAYHETTKLDRIREPRIARRVSAVLGDPRTFREVMRGWKSYPAAPRVPLPPAALPATPLGEVLARRRSHLGGFADASITLGELATLLGASYGPTGYRALPGGAAGERVYQRASASAGGLYPLELYPIALAVDGLPAGVYHYDVLGHALDEVRPGVTRDAVLACMSEDDAKRTMACALAVTAVLPRTMSKYLARGYRFVLNDAGTLLGSLSLATTALDLAGCAQGGFYDDELGALLGADNVDEVVMLLVAIGRAHGPRNPR